jgi:hypothetical protein
MARTLATDEAKSKVAEFKSLVTGQLEGLIVQMDGCGQFLSEPNNWDGPKAIQFRSDLWPSTHTALQVARTKLDELQTAIDTILGDIMVAGS